VLTASQLGRALRIVWVVVSAVLMLAVLVPFVTPADTVYGLMPACEARLRGEPCMLCGMTTAYVRLAASDVASALDANRWSLTLWLGSVVNFALAKAYILFRLVQVCAGRRSEP
jgi:hypothetical protein